MEKVRTRKSGARAMGLRITALALSMLAAWALLVTPRLLPSWMGLDKPSGPQLLAARQVPSADGKIVSTFNPSSGPAEGPAYSYRWRQGQKHAYDFSFRVGDKGNSTYDIAGSCVYSIGRERTLEDDQRGTGTAFAIAPGYLATCAHVVESASRIVAVFGDRRYTTRVVDVDKGNDLAILAIEGEPEIAAVPLGSSASLELAESVLVIGFPMSDVLGSGVKIASGIVSGIDDTRGGQAIALDGAINPGNSGGPVLNYSGEVVGLASATLQGDLINAVGFASQVDGLKALMEKNGIEVGKPGAALPQQAKEIARRITPSVGLLEVSGWAEGRCHEISASVHYKRGVRNPALMVNMMLNRGRSKPMLVSRLGELRRQGSDEQLPHVFASLPELLFQSFDLVEKQEWSVHKTYVIKSQTSLHMDALRMQQQLHNRFFGDGFPEPEPELETKADLKVRYELIQADARKIRVKKLRHFKTQDDPQKPSLEVAGEGVWEFDLMSGVPISLQENLTVIQHSNGRKTEVPVFFEFTRRDQPATGTPSPQSRTTIVERGSIGRDGTVWHPFMPEYGDGTVESVTHTSTPESVDKLLAELRIKDDARRLAALAELAVAPALSMKRQEVLKLLRAAIGSQLTQLHQPAWKAYRRWMDESSAGELRRVIEKSVQHRAEATQALIDLGLEADAPLMLQNVNTLTLSQLRKLKRYGSKIETAALDALFETSDVEAQGKLLGIIVEVGSSESVRRLKEFKSGADPSLQAELSSTILLLSVRQF